MPSSAGRPSPEAHHHNEYVTLWEASVISLSGTISLADLFCYLNVLPW